jgi:hypothetical protein
MAGRPATCEIRAGALILQHHFDWQHLHWFLEPFAGILQQSLFDSAASTAPAGMLIPEE